MLVRREQKFPMVTRLPRILFENTYRQVVDLICARRQYLRK